MTARTSVLPLAAAAGLSAAGILHHVLETGLMQEIVSLIAAVSPVAAVLIGWWLGRRDVHQVGGQVAEGIENTRKQVVLNVENARQQVEKVSQKIEATRQQVVQTVQTGGEQTRARVEQAVQKVEQTRAKVSEDVAATKANEEKLDRIHELVNSGRSELLKRIADLTATIAKLLPEDSSRAADAKRAREDARDHGVIGLDGDGGLPPATDAAGNPV